MDGFPELHVSTNLNRGATPRFRQRHASGHVSVHELLAPGPHLAIEIGIEAIAISNHPHPRAAPGSD
jgi:hypothetical protein